MNKLLRVTATAGVLALSGLAATSLQAQDGPPQAGPSMRRMGPGGPGGPGFGPPGGPMGLLGPLGRGLRELGLTDAQREQVRGIMTSHETGFRAIGDRLRTAREALDAAITADTLDEATIRARSAEVAAIEADAAVLRGRVHQELWSILTAEQQAKARELKTQAQSRIKARASRARQRGAGAAAR